jgi:hypothetical protein
MPNTLMRSVVLIATRRLQDEEIFLNYRYNPANPVPDWYSPVDIEEAKRRWGRRSWWD